MWKWETLRHHHTSCLYQLHLLWSTCHARQWVWSWTKFRSQWAHFFGVSSVHIYPFIITINNYSFFFSNYIIYKYIIFFFFFFLPLMSIQSLHIPSIYTERQSPSLLLCLWRRRCTVLVSNSNWIHVLSRTNFCKN